MELGDTFHNYEFDTKGFLVMLFNSIDPITNKKTTMFFVCNKDKNYSSQGHLNLYARIVLTEKYYKNTTF